VFIFEEGQEGDFPYIISHFSFATPAFIAPGENDK
jgi:hypothetical protein